MNDKRIIEIGTWDFICVECGTKNKHHTYGDMGSYGRFIGKTSKGENTEWYALDEPVFQEASKIVKEIIHEKKLTTRSHSTCLHAVLCVVCDPSPSGEEYHFGLPKCSNCGSSEIKYHGDLYSETVYMPFVTFTQWLNLSLKEKYLRITKKLQKTGWL